MDLVEAYEKATPEYRVLEADATARKFGIRVEAGSRLNNAVRNLIEEARQASYEEGVAHGKRQAAPVDSGTALRHAMVRHGWPESMLWLADRLGTGMSDFALIRMAVAHHQGIAWTDPTLDGVSDAAVNAYLAAARHAVPTRTA